MNHLFAIFLLAAAAFSGIGRSPMQINAAAAGEITIRTENYPRPPYSGATYYIYERDGEVICTKLSVCNKYDDCSVIYKKGPFKEDEDIETGEPYGRTDPVVIPRAKLKKHVCLTRFRLVK